MKNYFELKNGTVVPSAPETSDILVYALPDDLEKKDLIDTLQIDQHALESALDPDEISRVEFTVDYLYIIWKRPNTASFKQLLKFEVSSMGIFVKQGRLTLILGEGTIPFDAKEFQGATSLHGIILKFFLHTIHHFLGHLKVIKQLNGELQSKLNLSLENQYLLQMFTLGESLIYYLNALEANAAVLTKLRSNRDKISFSREELEMLDDIAIEHQQCCRQAQIYSSVLSGLMDARGSIINNNMNILLRNLTLINVVFLPLNLIASIGGMSEYTKMTEGVIDWGVAYLLFITVMVALGIVTWIFLVKQINRQKIVREKNFKA
jgi:magnesium transporter